MKRTAVAIIITLCMLLCGCSADYKINGKLTVTATLFPQYDFCRQIVGNRAEVLLLLPAGMESHNYEPSVADIMSINQSDIFIYIGAGMEPWAETVIDGADGDMLVVDSSKNIELQEHIHGDGDEHEEEHHGEEEHAHEDDPHIWTDPVNAIQMVKNILEALCEKDPTNSAYYTKNAEAYIIELEMLNTEFEDISARATTHTVCHGGRFSMTYFAKRYGFTFVAAFDSCASESEPSMARVIELIDTVKANKLRAVFYEELTTPKTAQVIADEAGCEMLLLHTCHNVSKTELANGITYVELMKQNAINLRKALI